MKIVMNPPPPMLPASGCTTARVKAAATAASTALPSGGHGNGRLGRRGLAFVNDARRGCASREHESAQDKLDTGGWDVAHVPRRSLPTVV
jgi:hypothetical protein